MGVIWRGCLEMSLSDRTVCGPYPLSLEQMQYNADAQQIETEIHIRVYDTRTHWIFYLKNKIRGKENLDTLFHSIWWKRGGCRILSPREKGCWIPRRSQSKVYECTGGPESSSTTVNTCSAGTILVYDARANSSQSKVYVYTAGWPGK